MDLYKWAAKLLPLLDSDISALGLEPVRIETPSGRAEYVREQAVVAERAAIVRRGLLARCRALLDPGSLDQR